MPGLETEKKVLKPQDFSTECILGDCKDKWIYKGCL